MLITDVSNIVVDFLFLLLLNILQLSHFTAENESLTVFFDENLDYLIKPKLNWNLVLVFVK